VIDAACELASAGWRVFPCWPAGPRAKSPLTEHGHLDATRNPELIRKWWTRWPYAMIGAAVPDSLIVLDVDPRNGGDTDDLGPLPPTLRVWSGRGDGGVHLYFRRPDGPVVATRLPRGVDLKGNGYCIVPPSVHPTSGKPYRWESRPVAGLPPRLLALLRPIEKPERPKIKSSNGAGLIRTVARAVEGKRDDTLFWAACRAVEDQIIDQIEDELIVAAVGVGLSEHQARAKIGSARRTVGNG
jgi:Bifunctional DNA primase/polymerase, N-terminal